MAVKKIVKTIYQLELSEDTYNNILNTMVKAGGMEKEIAEFTSTSKDKDFDSVMLNCSKLSRQIHRDIKKIKEMDKPKEPKEIEDVMVCSKYIDNKERMYNKELILYLGNSSKGNSLKPVIIDVWDFNFDKEMSSKPDKQIALNSFNAIRLANELAPLSLRNEEDYYNSRIDTGYYCDNDGNISSDVTGDKFIRVRKYYESQVLHIKKGNTEVTLNQEEIKAVVDYIKHHKEMD